jgi:hypothetical protein
VIRTIRRMRRWTRRRMEAAGSMWEDVLVRVPEVRGRRGPES